MSGPNYIPPKERGRTTEKTIDYDIDNNVDTETPATNKVIRDRLNDAVNMELFYNQQITNLNMSWLLRHTKSNLCIVGITQEQAYGFSVDNQYNSGLGGAFADILKKAEEFIGSAQKQVPLVNQALDHYIPELGEKLTKIGDQTQETDGESLGGAAQNLFKEGATWAGNTLTNFASNADKVRHDTNGMVGSVISSFFDGKKLGIADFANGKFITSADKVMTYAGSNLSITLPELKTIIFHNPVSNGTNVLDMTNALLEQMAPYTQEGTISGLYALQRSPGGYEANMEVFNGQEKPMRGTWTLTWNGYEMKNLLISKLDVSYSKYNAMNNEGLDSGDPLYAEISISVTPASMLFTKDIINIMGTTKKRTRYDLSGWLDSDEQDKGVTSKESDVAPVGIVDEKSINSNTATSYKRKT